MASDSYSRKLGPLKAMCSGTERNQRPLGMFPVTFSDEIIGINILFICSGSNRFTCFQFT